MRGDTSISGKKRWLKSSAKASGIWGGEVFQDGLFNSSKRVLSCDKSPLIKNESPEIFYKSRFMIKKTESLLCDSVF
jgi:hypothetical protein